MLGGTYALYGVSFAMAFASFVLGRYLAGSAFHVRERVAPFGEAPPSGFEGARPGARLAITLAGPLGVYLFAAFLVTLGLLLAGSARPGTSIVGVVPSGPAAAVGLREGDRITTIAGRHVALPSDVRDSLAAEAGPFVDVGITRDRREVRFQVPLGDKRRLGVQFGPDLEPVGVGRALGEGLTYPAQVLFNATTALFDHVKVEVIGPVAIANMVYRQPTFGDRLRTIGLTETFGVPFFLLGSLALWPPRARRRAEPAAARSASAQETPSVGRPWRRFLARLLDWCLLALVLTLAARPASYLMIFLWLPIEALLLSTWGFTLGKWSLGIAIRDAQGQRLTFRSAFRRAALVWAYGIGADTPFALATGMLAYAGLKRTGITYWDTLGGHTVEHRPVGAARVALAMGLVLGVLIVSVVVASTS